MYLQYARNLSVSWENLLTHGLRSKIQLFYISMQPLFIRLIKRNLCVSLAYLHSTAVSLESTLFIGFLLDICKSIYYRE